MMMPMRPFFSRSQRVSANPSSPGRPTSLDEPVQCRTAIDGADPEILLGEIIGEQLPLRRLVLDHDDMGPRVHGLPAGKRAIKRRLD